MRSGWKCYDFLLPQMIILLQIIDPSGLAWNEMLFESWAVLAYTDWTIAVVKVWQWSQVVPIHITSLHEVRVTVVWLSPASNDHSPPNNWPLRFGKRWNAVQCLIGSSSFCLKHWCCGGLTVLSVCYYAYNKPPPCQGKCDMTCS